MIQKPTSIGFSQVKSDALHLKSAKIAIKVLI